MKVNITGYNEFQGRRIMPPPWMVCPYIRRSSVGWRTGFGGAYAEKFQTWLKMMTPKEKKVYREMFPERITWKGWWDGEDKTELLRYKNYSTCAWREGGKPKYTRAQLIKEWEEGNGRPFCYFWDHDEKDGTLTQSCLSQWYPSKFSVGIYQYNCMEQYMMAEKADLFSDEKVREKIFESDDPAVIQALGRTVIYLKQDVWDEFKHSIVVNGNWRKFTQNKKLRDFLHSTGENIIVEASPYDTIWGIGASAYDEEARDPRDWKGENMLGFALMEVRDELRRVYRCESSCDWTYAKKKSPGKNS